MSSRARLQLEGKVAVITGASSGSGLSITRRFLAEGALVVMLARGEQRLKAVAAELGERAIPIVADVAHPDSVRAAFAEAGERFGKLDVLINNAAVYRPCAAAAIALWRERGLLSQVLGRYGGQDVDAIGDVHVFIVTRPRTQKLDTVYCRSF